MPTNEQDAILAHSPDRHGRVLAGPGTGKSTTVVSLATRLHNEEHPATVRITTFTRAATAELLDKAIEEGHDELEPRTVHSFALSILLRNPGVSPLPEPLRIPDDWESKMLVQTDIARRLRLAGFDGIDRRAVDKLESELAASWESLNPETILLADIDPKLRNAYVGIWKIHREVFGYSLFAEMPLYAGQALADHDDLSTPDVDLLIVDEFQDLNRAEIRLLEGLALFGVRILAVGDDDQSIYGFRMADPSGILNFPSFFPNAEDYALSTSFRCGSRILEAARALIESSPGRTPKASLRAGEQNPPGDFRYLRFEDEGEERRGVVRLVETLIQREGLQPSEIAILVRGDFNSHWSRPLRELLTNSEIPATDVEGALEPLSERGARQLIAVGRLVENPLDDLAWWALMTLRSGVSDDFINLVADQAAERGERFGQRLLGCDAEAPVGASSRSLSAARTEIARVRHIVESLYSNLAAASEIGWAEWLLGQAGPLEVPISNELARLMNEVGSRTPQEDGLSHFLNQMEPVTKDLALRTDAVSIMTMSRSKGLTFRAVVVMGVEETVIPAPRATDLEEERRLLYVAITRAREYSFLTMARRRHDATARTGGGAPRASRGRCPFFREIGIRPEDGAAYVRRFVTSS